MSFIVLLVEQKMKKTSPSNLQIDKWPLTIIDRLTGNQVPALRSICISNFLNVSISAGIGSFVSSH